MTIDRHSPMPMYYQLKRLLLAKIESGELKHDDILPTEQQLQETYNLSRTTVRQALYELECEGVVYRQRGRGTFVNKFTIGPPAKKPTAQSRWHVISARWEIPAEAIKHTLEAHSGEKMFRLERIRLENDRPMAYHVAYVAPEFTGVIDEAGFTQGDSLHYLRDPNLLEVCYADVVLEAITADEKLARLLDGALNEPLMQLRRIIRTPAGKPVELLNSVYYRGNRFHYHANGRTLHLKRSIIP